LDLAWIKAVSFNKINMKNKLIMLAVAGLVAAAASVSQAQPYYVVGTYNGWANPSAAAMTGGPVTYDYTITGQTPGGFGQLKVTDGTWANAVPSQNFTVQYDGTGSATIHFYPGTITPADGWSPLGNRVGFDDPGSVALEISGDFTAPNWGSDPLAQMTLQAGSVGVYTNIYIVAIPGSYNFKFRSPGTWANLNIGADMGSGPNCVFTTTTPNQAVLIKLDLPNARWQAGGPPAFCNVQFSVDMTLVVANNPGFDPTSVTVNGDAIPLVGWGGTACTNDPTAANPNIYTSSNQLIAVGTSVQYQFRCLINGITQYDAKGGVGGQNRSVVVPNLASTNLPPVYWNDASPSDYLDADTAVTFSVNMTNAVLYPSGPAFNPGGGDLLFMNGDFIGWLAWNPISLAPYQLTETPVGSSIYTYSQVFPKGNLRSVTYKYAVNGIDNETAPYQNHFRFIRTTGGAAYNMPLDIFGNPVVEPKVGGLAIGKPSGGLVPITWLPYPNVHLQSRSDLTSGTWLDVPSTTGASSISVPVGSVPQFFRLIQPTP
jgi:hypothetical protein